MGQLYSSNVGQNVGQLAVMRDRNGVASSNAGWLAVIRETNNNLG